SMLFPTNGWAWTTGVNATPKNMAMASIVPITAEKNNGRVNCFMILNIETYLLTYFLGTVVCYVLLIRNLSALKIMFPAHQQFALTLTFFLNSLNNPFCYLRRNRSDISKIIFWNESMDFLTLSVLWLWAWFCFGSCHTHFLAFVSNYLRHYHECLE